MNGRNWPTYMLHYLGNEPSIWQPNISIIRCHRVKNNTACYTTSSSSLFEIGNFLSAWSGISSLQFGLSLFWTEAKKRSFSIADVSHFLSYNPSKLCGLQDSKGQIKEGMDADLVIWDPEAKFQVCSIIMLNTNNAYIQYVKTCSCFAYVSRSLQTECTNIFPFLLTSSLLCLTINIPDFPELTKLQRICILVHLQNLSVNFEQVLCQQNIMCSKQNSQSAILFLVLCIS